MTDFGKDAQVRCRLGGFLYFLFRVAFSIWISIERFRRAGAGLPARGGGGAAAVRGCGGHEKDLVAVAAAASMEEPEKEAELEEDAVVAAPGAKAFSSKN